MNKDDTLCSGLTKREYIAINLHAVLLRDGCEHAYFRGRTKILDNAASEAVKQADMLIMELEKDISS